MTVTAQPSSSRTSRTAASAGLSPGSTFPPGSSQRPAASAGEVRRAASRRPCARTATPTTTRGVHRPERSAGQLTGLRDQPAGRVPDLSVLLEEAAGEVAGGSRDPQPARRRHRPHVRGQLQGRRPAEHPEVERSPAAARPPPAAACSGSGSRPSADPQPALQHPAPGRLAERPADAGRVQPQVEPVQDRGLRPEVLRRLGRGHAALGRRQVRRRRGGADVVGQAASRSPYVASARIRSTSAAVLHLAQRGLPVDMLRPLRSTSVRTVAAPGPARGQVVGADRQRVGCPREEKRARSALPIMASSRPPLTPGRSASPGRAARRTPPAPPVEHPGRCRGRTRTSAAA